MQDSDKARLLEPFFKRLTSRDEVSAEERQVIISAGDEVRTVTAKTDLVREGDRPKNSTLILGGIAARYSMVEDGGRQITAFQIAGDFVDLQSFVMKTMDHGITAVTDISVLTFPHERLRVITENYPHLTRLLWFTTLLDEAVHRQWLVAMGRMPGVSHMAHLFCEHYLRAKAAGLTTGLSYPFPITQIDLADALGMSAVHTNRILGELRRKELIIWDGKIVQIPDWHELRRVGMFDPAFLHTDEVEI